jgi:hypothetical protein
MLLHDNGAAENIGGCGRQAQKQANKNGMHLRRMISVPRFRVSQLHSNLSALTENGNMHFVSSRAVKNLRG